jgi:hypothetical protein
MQDKRKSNKEEMRIEENINKQIEQDKKAMVKEGSSTRTKERNSKSASNVQKKVTSSEAIKSETNKVLPTIKEKEIIAKSTEAKVEPKSKETAKKTSARKSVATKTSVGSEEKQEIALKTQGNKDSEIDKTKKKYR